MGDGVPGGDSLVEHLGMASALEVHDCDGLGYPKYTYIPNIQACMFQ